MEVLLLQDIAGVGKKNDLLVVGDGFALNYLLPRRAALVATPLVRKRYAEFIRRRAEEREKEKMSQAGAAKAVDGKTLTFKRKATKAGKLYAGVTDDNIRDALKEQLNTDVESLDIALAEPIKSIGTFPVTMKIADQTVRLNVVVEAEKSEK